MDKQNNRDQAYGDRTDTERSPQTGNINDRTSNVNNKEAPAVTDEQAIERANDAGLGDKGWNDERMTPYTSNHSGDA